MWRKFIFILLLIPLVLFSAQAQEMIYGRYTPKDLEITEVDFDPEAVAVVLGEMSTNHIVVPEVESTVLRRIKVLKTGGIKYGTVAIPYYHGSNGVVKISKLKAQITNILNGEKQTIALKDGDFFTVDKENGWKEIRFTLPDVQVGSIIDYQYFKTDRRLTILEGWVFQNDIPTLLSIYSMEIPSHLKYRVLSQGEQTLRHRFDSKKDGNYKWILKNLQSFKEEPYMSNPSDYYEKIEFQLAGYGFRSSTNVFADWVELAKFIVNIEEVRSYMKPNKSSQQKLMEIQADGETQLQKAKSLYSYILDNYEFDGYSGILPTDQLKDLLNSKKSSRPELNLMFLALLNQNGIDAYPVLISSKGNGRSHIVDSPFADQFNQLILAVMADGKAYFADVTHGEVPFGYLPLVFHVEQGFLIKDKDSGLIPVQLTHRSGIQQAVNFQVDDLGGWAADIKLRFLDYDGIKVDQSSAKYGEEHLRDETFGLQFEGIRDFSFLVKNDPRKTLDVNWNRLFENNSSELLFIEPFQFQRFSENPFKSDSRVFPVDFYYSFHDNFTATIEIPEGYILDDYPEDSAISLTQNSFTFNYKVTPLDNSVRINATIDLKKHILPAHVYEELKYFMELITSKLTEPIVLKKLIQP